MKLDKAIAQLETLNKDGIICARAPWSSSSQCVVVSPDENLGVPKRFKDDGFIYFLEVNVAQEVLGVFDDVPHCPTQEEKVRLLIYYAENDAYPEWVYME
jgi:hypothetical protein